MMAYILVEDVEDEVLASLIQESDLEAATNRIKSIARSLGVSEDEIAQPLADEVKELAVAIACERRAKFSVGTATRSDQGVDVYEIKRRAYAKDVERLSGQMTVELMTNDVTSKGDLSYTIELFRS